MSPTSYQLLHPATWWRGKDSNLRRLSRQIYSLLPLTAREPLHNTYNYEIVSGADEGTRTPDLLITNQPLYQLSYVGLTFGLLYYTRYCCGDQGLCYPSAPEQSQGPGTSSHVRPGQLPPGTRPAATRGFSWLDGSPAVAITGRPEAAATRRPGNGGRLADYLVGAEKRIVTMSENGLS
jgi:hypothetical protein